jgi:hypothetical protein
MTDARRRTDSNEFLEAFAEELRGRPSCRHIDSMRAVRLTADFVEAGAIEAQSLGAFSLKGVGAEQEIFVPARSG